jgi:phosphoglycolate phosphatase
MSAAVVFDLDGTLIDSLPDIQSAVNRMLAGIGQPPMDRAEVRSYVGNGAPVLVGRVLSSRAIPVSRHPDILARFLPDYAARSAEATVGYPGVTEALSALRDAGHRLGICTNKPLDAARSVLITLNLSPFFETLIGWGSLPQSKPDPAPLHAAIAALGGGPAIFAGDSEVDVATAVNAGIPMALYLGGYLREPKAADHADAVFDDFADLPALVARLAR